VGDDAVIVLREFRDGDAEAVVRLLNESEEGWPGGFTGGVRLTTDYVRNRVENMDNMLILVAWHGERAVGFMQMTRHWADPQAGYVTFINVHPGYRGKGIGTRLLKAALKKALEEGLLRVDLHTWGGNARAMRVYKKLGFMWVPGTRVYMQNYLPSLARLPGLKGLLESDELFSFKKNLEPVEDGVLYHGRRLFVYDWGDGRRLIADYRSWRVVGAEWPGVKVFVAAPEKVVRGFSYHASVEADEVPWEPWSSEGVEASRVGDGIDFAVKPGLPPRMEDEPSRSVGIRVGSWDIVFAAGFRDYEPLSVERVHPSALKPGDRRVHVSLVNKGGDDLHVTLYAGSPVSRRLKEGEGLVAEFPAHAAPPTWRHVVYYKAALAGEERVFSVTASAPVATANTLGYSIDEEEGVLTVAAPQYRAEVSLRGGRVEVYSQRAGLIAEISESVGPPLWPNEVSRVRFLHRVRWLGDRLILVLNAYLPSRSVWLEKRITFHVTPPRIDFTYRLEGKGERVLEISAWGLHHFDEKIWVPLRGKVVEIDVLPGETLTNRYVLPIEPEAYGAPWTFRRRVDGLGIATLWSREGLFRVDHGSGKLPSLRYRVSMEDGAHASFTLLLGLDNWEDVAKAYSSEAGAKLPGETVRELEPRLEPPIVSTASRAVDLVVETWRRRRTSGILRAYSQELGLDISGKFTLDEEKREYRVTVPLKPGIGLGAYSVNVDLDTTHGVASRELPLVVLWDPGQKVSVEGGAVDNGYMVLRADPGYAGVLYSVEIGGVNNLYTPYPERGVLDWINPWLGGVQLELGDARLWEEVWEMRRAAHGLFTGIEVASRLEDKLEGKMRGFTVRQQYLTLPGSNLVYLRLILENTTGRILKAPPFFQVFVRPGGELADKFQLDYGPDKLVWRRHPGARDEPYRLSKRGYAAVYSSRGAVVAVPLSKDWMAAAVCYGERGCHFWFEARKNPPLKPGERRVYESAIVFLEEADERLAERYRVLRDAAGSLPIQQHPGG